MHAQHHPIVIWGSEDDGHVRAVRDGLLSLGLTPMVLDSLRFPGEFGISLGEELGEIAVSGTEQCRPAAVYLRSLYQSPVAYGAGDAEAMRQNWQQTLLKYQERNTLIAAVLHRWAALGVPVYNPLAVDHDITKPYQLARLAAAGLPVPRTLWSNEPEQVRQFAAKGPVVYKPIDGGAATRLLREQDLERLERLRAAPVTFQEHLPGDDIRVYVLDDKVIARLRILSDAVESLLKKSTDGKLASMAAVSMLVGVAGRDWSRSALQNPHSFIAWRQPTQRALCCRLTTR